MPSYVTFDELVCLLGTSANSERVTLATDAANLLIPVWCPQACAGTPGVETEPPAVDAITKQAALELAHELYRSHAAVGGVFAVEELVSRLPADRVRPIRDLLDARTYAWGIA